jgi:hypothetical protein
LGFTLLLLLLLPLLGLEIVGLGVVAAYGDGKWSTATR